MCTRTTVRVQKHGGEPWIARNKAGLCRDTTVSQHKVGFVGTNRGMRARTQACAHLPRWMRAHPGSGATTGVCMHAHGSRSAFVQVNTGVYKSCVRSHPLCSSETTRCGLVPLHRSRLPQHSTLVLWHQTQVLAHRTQVPPHHTPVRLFASLGGLWTTALVLSRDEGSCFSFFSGVWALLAVVAGSIVTHGCPQSRASTRVVMGPR